MRKRILSMFLVAAMAVTMLAGCGNTTKQEENKKTSTAAFTDKKSEEPAKKEEPVTVKWLMWGDETKDYDAIMEAINEKLVEKINVKLDLELIPYAEYAERCKLASTSNEQWDILYTSNWKNIFSEYMAREAFLDITDIVEEHGQDIIANLQPELWDVATVDGRCYAIPNQQIAARRCGVFIQKSLAEKYNWTKNHVDDWRELIPLLDAIRDNEKDITPIHCNQALFYDKAETLVSIAAIRTNDDPKDGIEVVWDTEFDDPEGFRIMSAAFYEAGYLHPDVVTGYDFNALKAAGKFGMFVGTASPYAEVSISNSVGIEHIMVTVGDAYFSMSAGQDTMLGINVNSKNPEAAVKVINAMWADEELYNTMLFGLEGVNYKKVGDQRVELIEGSDWKLYEDAWAVGNSFAKWKVPGEEDDIYELTSELNRNSKISPIRGFSVDTTNLSSEIAQISAVKKEYDKMQYEENWEENLDEYRQAMIDAGIETLVAEVQRQLDEWLAVNK